MFDQSTHTMELAQIYASGAQEWQCPTCGRRMIMQWPPKYKKIVLEPGDELALHAGGTGGLQLGSAVIGPAGGLPASAEPGVDFVRPPDDTTPDPADTPAHENLRPWLRFFNDNEFNS
jgi:hypothetical protein